MNDILQDLSTPNLITAIEANQYALLSAVRSWPRVQVHDTPEILWFMTDIPSPLFNDDKTLRLWSQVFSEGFEIADFPDFADIICDYMRHVDPDATLTYLGRLEDKPVATSTLIFGAGVAGIYNVATIPEARRQGIGGMMTLAPLR